MVSLYLVTEYIPLVSFLDFHVLPVLLWTLTQIFCNFSFLLAVEILMSPINFIVRQNSMHYTPWVKFKFSLCVNLSLDRHSPSYIINDCLFMTTENWKTRSDILCLIQPKRWLNVPSSQKNSCYLSNPFIFIHRRQFLESSFWRQVADQSAFPHPCISQLPWGKTHKSTLGMIFQLLQYKQGRCHKYWGVWELHTLVGLAYLRLLSHSNSWTRCSRFWGVCLLPCVEEAWFIFKLRRNTS